MEIPIPNIKADGFLHEAVWSKHHGWFDVRNVRRRLMGEAEVYMMALPIPAIVPIGAARAQDARHRCHGVVVVAPPRPRAKRGRG